MAGPIPGRFLEPEDAEDPEQQGDEDEKDPIGLLIPQEVERQVEEEKPDDRDRQRRHQPETGNENPGARGILADYSVRFG